MTSPRRTFWLLLLCGAPLMAGCELLQHFSQPAKQPPPTEPIAGAPSKYEVPVSPFVFISDVKIGRDQAIFKDLSNLRDQVCTELRLPPSNTLVTVYLFEDKKTYDKFIKTKHPELPDRRAFFIAQPRRFGGGEDLLVYTYLGDTIHQDLRHELTHSILHSVLKNVPIWLDEGLAEYFEQPAGSAGVHRKHLDALRQPGTRFDLDRLEKLEEVKQMGIPEYCESWAWVHLMLRSTPQAKQALLGYLQDLRINPNPSPLRPRLAGAFVSPNDALQAHLNETATRLPVNVAAKR